MPTQNTTVHFEALTISSQQNRISFTLTVIVKVEKLKYD